MAVDVVILWIDSEIFRVQKNLVKDPNNSELEKKSARLWKCRMERMAEIESEEARRPRWS